MAAFSGERFLDCWCFVDTARHRRLIGIDPASGAVVLTGVLTAVERSEPPRWVATSTGLHVTLGQPGLPRDEDTADMAMDAIDVLRAIATGPAVNEEIRLVPWRPLPRRLSVAERRTA